VGARRLVEVGRGRRGGVEGGVAGGAWSASQEDGFGL
jgi:hypothetical protein